MRVAWWSCFDVSVAVEEVCYVLLVAMADL